MASAETLDKLLRELTAAVMSDVQHREFTANRIAEDIAGFCTNNEEMLNQGFISSRLFAQKTGILELLRGIRKDEFAKTKEILLDLLTEVIPKLGTSVLPHIDTVKATCTRLSLEKLSKVQKASFGPLIKLFGLCDQLDPEEQAALEKRLQISKLWEDLVDRFLFSRKTEVKDTALGHAMELIGTIARQFPNSIPPPKARVGTDVVLEQFVGQLERAVVAESKSRAVVPGALRGLVGLLDHRKMPCNCSPKKSKCVLCRVLGATTTVVSHEYLSQIGTFGAPRAAAQLLATHGGLFRAKLLADHQSVYLSLKGLCEHKNADLKRDGFAAMDTFLREIMADPSATNKKFVRFYLADFMKILRSPSSRRACGMALRGVGLLAAPLHAHEPAEVGMVYQWVVLRCTQSLQQPDFEANTESLELLPVYLEALASVAPFGPESSENFFILLDKMIQALMQHLIRMRKYQLPSVPPAVHRTLGYFAGNGAELQRVLKALATCGLYAVCTLPISPETQDEDASNLRKYRTFWRSVFEMHTEAGDLQIPSLLFDEVVKATLQLVGRLEIGFEAARSPDAAAVPDPEDKILLSLEPGQPVSPVDNQAFNVLVEFVSELLIDLPAEQFTKWTSHAIHTLISLSMKPENFESSGLYNLLHTCVATACRAGFFSANDFELTGDAKATCKLLRDYVIEVQERARHYQNELQSACIRFILALPPQLFGTDVGPFIPTLQTALVNGTGYYPLAVAAFDALEMWVGSIPDRLEPHLEVVLPYLEAYLKPGDEVQPIVSSERVRTSRTRKATSADSNPTKATESASFSTRAVRILGRLGNDLNRQLLKRRTDKSDKPSWIAWSTIRIMEYNVDFFGKGHTVCLDDLLPLLVGQSTTANSRRTKLAACEALHTTITALVARTSKETKDASAALWQPVFAAILRLACDIEVVVVKLFEPLMMQIIRWVSGGHGVPPEVQKVIFDCVLNELVNPESSSLRKVSARCVAEIFRWGEKETSTKALERDPDNPIAILLQRTCSLAIHPDKYRRLGAAMIVNAVYRGFRENATLVSKYVFDLIVTFVNSLKYQQARGELDAIADQTAHAIRHLVRMIQATDGGSTSHAQTVIEESDFRVVPSGWDTPSPTLENLLLWSVQQLFNRTERRLLDSCWHIVRRCAPALVEESDNAIASWIAEHQSDTSSFCQSLEGPLRSLTDVMPSVDDIRKYDPLTLSWVSALDAALQNLNTVIGFKLVPPAKLFGCKLEVLEQLTKFIEMLQNGEEGREQAQSTVSFDRLLRGLTDRALRFIGFLLKEKPRLPAKNTKEFALFVVQCGLAPERYGFRDVNSWRTAQIPALVERILTKVPQGDFLKSLVNALEVEMADEANDLCTQARTMLHEDTNQLRIHVLAEGYQLMHSVKMLLKIVETTQKKSKEELSSELLRILMEAITRGSTRSPATMMACRAVFDLAVAVHIPRQRLLECVMAVEHSSGRLMDVDHAVASQAPSGEQFLQVFRDELAGYFVRHAKHLLPMLFDNAEKAVVMKLLHAVLREASKAVVTRKHTYELEDVRNRIEAVAVFLDCAFGPVGIGATDDDPLIPRSVAGTQQERFVDEASIIASIVENSDPEATPGLVQRIQEHERFPAFARRLLVLLKKNPATELSLGEKSSMLPGLPLCSAQPGYRTAVQTFVRQHLLDPPGANHLDKSEYHHGLRDFIRVAISSRDESFLEGLAQMACCSDPDHTAEFGPDIQEALQVFAESATEGAVVDVLTLSMGWCLPPTAAAPENAWMWLKPELSQTVVRRVTVPMLQASPRNVALLFCEAMMDPVLAATDEAYLTVDAGRCTTSPDAVLQCHRKGACFAVLGALFDALTEADVRSGVIELQFAKIKRLGDQGPNMFYKSMCKPNNPASLVGTLKTAQNWSCCEALDCPLREARRQLACSAFNALGAMHVCAQPKEKLANIANKFFLKLDAYSALIDVHVPLHAVFTFPRGSSESVIRRRGEQWYLFELDIMDVDLRHALRSVDQGPPKPSHTEHVISVHKENIFRAARGVSGHESFPSFLQTIDAVLTASDGIDGVPDWLNTMISSFEEAEHVSSQTFLASTFMLRSEKFSQWAEELTGHLVKYLATYIETAGPDAGQPIGIDAHAFGIATVLLEWKTLGEIVKTKDGKESARRLLCAVLRSLSSTRETSHTGNNVFLLSALVQEWRGLKEYIPYDVIFELLKRKDAVGPMALQAVLAHGLKPWEKLHTVELAKKCELMPYLKALLATLDADKGEVFLNGALCIGATIKFLRSAGINQRMVDGFSKEMKSKIDSGPRKLANPVKFVQIVHRVYAGGDTTASQTWLEAVCDKKAELAKLSTVKHEIVACDIMVDAARDVHDIWATISKVGFKTMISFRNGIEQRAALHILANGLGQTSLNEYNKWILQDLRASMKDNDDESTRATYYDFLKLLWSHVVAEGEDKLKCATIEQDMLAAFSDSSRTIRQGMLSFWGETLELEKDCSARLCDVFERAYSADLERSFVSTAAYLLLDLGKSCDREVGFSSLGGDFEDEYMDFSAEGDGSIRHVHMSSMYSASRKRAAAAMSGSDGDGDGGFVSQAFSQSLMFSQTQSQFEGIPDSLFTAPDATLGTLSTQIHYGETVAMEDETSESLDMQRVERRRIRTQIRRRRLPISTSSAFRGDKRTRKVEERSRRKEVAQLYRKYRAGQLPDMQIKHSDLVIPYQALAFADDLFAQKLLGLFGGAIVRSDRFGSKLKARLNSSFARFFESMPPSPSSVFVDVVCELALASPCPTLDATNIRNRCVQAGILQHGILLLEHQITTAGVPPPQQKRRKGGTSDSTRADPNDTRWTEVAALYKVLGDEDALASICAQSLGPRWRSCGLDDVPRAVDLEAVSDFDEALALFDSILSENQDSLETRDVNLLSESRDECAYQLCRWSELAFDPTTDDLRDAVGGSGGVGRTRLIECSVQQAVEDIIDSLNGNENSSFTKAFLDNVDEILQTDAHDAFVTSFSANLAILYCAGGIHEASASRLDSARYYATKAVDNFCASWSSLHPLMRTARARALQQVQGLVEVEEILEVVSSAHDKRRLSSLAEDVISSWTKRLAASARTDMYPIWEAAVSRRELLFATAHTHTVDSMEDGAEGEFNTLLSARVANTLGAVRKATEKAATHSLGLARLKTAIGWIKAASGISSSCRLQIGFDINIANINAKLREFVRAGQEASSKLLLPLLGALASYTSAGDSDKAAWLQSESSGMSAHVAVTTEVMQHLAFTPPTSDFGKFAKSLPVVSAAFFDGVEISTPSALQECALDFMTTAMRGDTAAVSDEPASSSVAAAVAEAQLRMGMFAKRCLDGKIHPEVDQFELISHAVRHILSAMSHGSTGAALKFPAILGLACSADVSDNAAMERIFVEGCEPVPTWLFIRWISQMIPHLSKSSAGLVHPIFSRLSEEYPGALTYPVMISYDQIVINGTSKQRSFATKLRSRVVSPLVERFVTELEALHDPQLILFDFKDEESTKESVEKLKKRLGMGLSRDELRGRGEIIRKFSATFKSPVEKLLKSIPKDKNKRDIAIVQASQSGGTKWDKELATCTSMKDYSHWLANFQRADHTDRIEMPGQYNPNCKPRPETHINVDSIATKVLRLSSMRKPKRIEIRGGDARMYRFLAKGGEDLRQDERVLQVMEIINAFFASNAECTSRDLHLRTYPVFPMTTRIGLLGWVDNTKVLKEVMDDKLDPQTRSKVFKEHDKWIPYATKRAAAYSNMYQTANRDAALQKWSLFQGLVTNPFALKQGVIELASCPQACLELQRRFGRSLAAMSAAQYVLGIGDRHRSNTLIDVTTGEVVGIDFGHAFGSACTYLRIPELMPFRLTPQLVNVFYPHGTSGWFRLGMIHSLNALVLSREDIVATLQVFVEDPLVEWTERASTDNKAHGKSDDDDGPAESTRDFCRRLIDTAERKLSQYNPAHIMEADLAAGHKGKKWFAGAVKVVQGGAETVRYDALQRGVQCESVSEQVDCLIDMATDPNILARTYFGWDPWA